MSADRKVVQLNARPAFVLEMQSERLIDCMVALQEAGFKITYIKDSMNRYRIDDERKAELFELLP